MINLAQRLQDYQQKNLYRRRKVVSTPQSVKLTCDNKEVIGFCSNNYLGLANHPALVVAFKQGADKYGVGSGASSLINGYTRAHQECEERFAEFLHRDRALYFANGYVANISVMMAITNAETIIYEDKFNHASLTDGALYSKATLKRYAHVDINHLKVLLAHARNKPALIVTDGVFSMEGDIAPLTELAEIARHHNANFMVDDAHGMGVFGKNGRGCLDIFNLSAQDVPILNCPLGKAFAVYGSIVSGSKELVESLIQFARPYIYSTAPPAALACAAMASLEIVENETWRREKLNYLIEVFKNNARKREINLLPSTSPIQTLRLGDVERSLWVSEQLWQRGFLVPALRPPSVPKNAASLRMTLSCLHSEEDINALLDCLADILIHANEPYCEKI